MNIESLSRTGLRFLRQPSVKHLRVAGLNTSTAKVEKPQLPKASLSPQLQSVIRNQQHWPGKPPPGRLPQNYKQTARKVIMAMVAAPIMIVTSYILFQRVFLGHERKHLTITPNGCRSTSG